MKSDLVLPYRTKRAIGKETPQYTQPWVSYLRTPLLGETKICHGFLVDPKLDGLDGIMEGSSDIVLTAAHCVLG
uniref:Peptidase S1 domain-containing protein n=1 Tax=Romanomermis culicivorax TaxID=13658 RepID=A0A915J633_ROMCU